MIIKRYQVGDYHTNCYFVINEGTKEAIIIDPGSEEDELIENIKELKITPKAIFITHAHHDHTGAIDAIRLNYDIPIYLNKKDEQMVAEGKKFYGPLCSDIKYINNIKENDEIDMAGLKIKCMETPGHTPGGVCYIIDNYMFSGDTLFAGSIGRTDMDGGDYDMLISIIRNKIQKLPDALFVMPGHGQSTTISDEKKYNPFF